MKKFRIFYQTKLGRSSFDGFIIRLISKENLRKGAVYKNRS